LLSPAFLALSHLSCRGTCACPHKRKALLLYGSSPAARRSSYDFFYRRQSDSRSPPPSKTSRAVSPVLSSPPPVRAAAAAAFKALSTKDIIKNVITPPMSPSSPVAMSPAAAVMLSPRLRKPASQAMPPPSHPPSSSPRSGKKSTPLKAKSSTLGVFKADFIVAEKKDKGVLSYLIRLLACDPPSQRLLLCPPIPSFTRCGPHTAPSGGQVTVLKTTHGSERAMFLMSGPTSRVLACIVTFDSLILQDLIEDFNQEKHKRKHTPRKATSPRK
jgi:hypothetical protein